MISTKNRDVAIDYFKMFATLLVMNSHAELLYPKYQFLASGGAIADALFMFCSGFTLFIGTKYNFANYYKRRLTRIIPTMMAVSVLSVLIGFFFYGTRLEGSNVGLLLTTKNYLYWILLFYIPLYFVRKFLERMEWVFVALFIIVSVAYFFPFKYETGVKGMWGSLYHDYKWFWYFVIMFFGAFVGKIKDKILLHPIKDCVLCVLCACGFYIMPALSKWRLEIAPFQFLMIPLLMAFCYYLYKCLNNKVFKKLYTKPCINWIVIVIGGLCLESYLIHMNLFTTTLNCLFPFNLVIIYITVLLAAYVVRCTARIILQTFQKEDYDWKIVFKVK